MGEWQPIETAPKGEPVIVTDGTGVDYGIFLWDGWRDAYEHLPLDDTGYGATHWMPMPKAPQ